MKEIIKVNLLKLEKIYDEESPIQIIKEEFVTFDRELALISKYISDFHDYQFNYGVEGEMERSVKVTELHYTGNSLSVFVKQSVDEIIKLLEE